MKVKSGTITRRRHKKILKLAKGYRGAKSKLYRRAKEQLLHSGQYAFRDRRARKRDFRKLWIARINAAARAGGLKYSEFMHGLALAKVELDRKQLAYLAYTDEAAFGKLVEVAKAALS